MTILGRVMAYQRPFLEAIAGVGLLATAPASVSFLLASLVVSALWHDPADGHRVVAACCTWQATDLPRGPLLPLLGSAYGPTWGRFVQRTYPTPGNHEYMTRGAIGYYRYFGSRAAAPVRPWYSFRLGSWHLVALNSNCRSVDCAAEAAWLRADLAHHLARCTLAYWHHPRFSSGHEGETRAVGPFWDALYAAGADLVLNGHDHDYERFALQDPLGHLDPVNGIREFVVGTGGAPWLPFRTVAANGRVRTTGTFGVLRLTLRPGGYRWRFVHAAGAPFSDHGSGICH